MLLQRLTILSLVLGTALVTAPRARADIESFKGWMAGTVICGELPQGGTIADLGMFPTLRVKSVVNNAGPASAIVFDSSNPTVLEDRDLGTPNWTCGGPGVGAGGEVGAPGENCVGYGNLLVVAENLDDANLDNLVDFPDDESAGGVIEFELDESVSAVKVTLVDIDGANAWVQIANKDDSLIVPAQDLGDNSVQTIQLGGIGSFRTIRVIFAGSGAVAQIEYFRTPLAVDEESLGSVKARYR